MAKVIAICGKICSGKSYFANQIKMKWMFGLKIKIMNKTMISITGSNM